MSAADRSAIRAGVIDEHEIFRRGVAACLQEEPGMQVVVDAAEGPVEAPLDAAIVSAQAALGHRFDCPVLVCAPSLDPRAVSDLPNDVKGVLPRATLTAAQLVGAVQAATAGLTVRVEPVGDRTQLDARSIDVLRLLAEGADTQQIAEALRCSSRTVKGVISSLHQRLHARNRAQAVAVGIRDGLI